MKAKNIIAGQVYKTKVLSRFSTTPQPLHQIKILAHVEGFVIFKQGPLKQAVETKSFIQTYIQACKYKLESKDFEYKGFLIVWDEGVFNIGNPVSCCALTISEAKSKINEMLPNKTQAKK